MKKPRVYMQNGKLIFDGCGTEALIFDEIVADAPVILQNWNLEYVPEVGTDYIDAK